MLDQSLQPESPQEFIRVSAAKKKYFSGAMSLRWWYRQIEDGKLPHFRAGGTVLLRPADIEALIATMFREQTKVKPEPVVPAPPKSRVRGGLRFFTE
jgi:hypothetical protein